LGADRGILIKTDRVLESLNIAKILQKLVQDEKTELVLMGKQAIDDDNNQTPQMLAALLDWPQATYASQINKTGETLDVTREVDGGLETLRVQLPAVVSTDLRLNEPRYTSLPNIMQAKRKPLAIINADEMGLSLKEHSQILKVSPPPVRTRGVMVDSVAALLDKLQHEAKVL
jgi:electron transfer flavoprotein beta subunit